MGYSYTGDALLRTSFEIMVPQPLDNRTVVDSEQDLYTLPRSSAYRGMTVANPDNGNIYMLLDPSQITSPTGWKASGISIITCTQDEYNALLENTNLEDYTPKGEGDYLRKDVYYYIPEEGDGTYLTTEWGKTIEEQLKTTATVSHVNEISKSLTQLSQKLAEEYSTTADIQKTYATLELTYSIEQADEKFLTKDDASSTYATKETVEAMQTTLENDYVTWQDIGNPDMEGEDLAFVTTKQYIKDKEDQAQSFTTEELKTTTTETQTLTIQKIEEKEVEQGEETIIQEEVTSESVLTSEENKLYHNGKLIALNEEIPVIEILSQSEYDNIPKEDIDPEKYYYTYDDTGDINNGYVTKDYVDTIVVLRSDIYAIVREITNPLQERIQQLESKVAELEAHSSNLDKAQLNKMKLG